VVNTSSAMRFFDPFDYISKHMIIHQQAADWDMPVALRRWRPTRPAPTGALWG
jgi:hypothetical protein